MVNVCSEGAKWSERCSICIPSRLLGKKGTLSHWYMKKLEFVQPVLRVSKWQKSNEAIMRLVGCATAAKLKVFANYLLSLLQESKTNPNLDEILKLITQQ